jgi:hypothetical protein
MLAIFFQPAKNSHATLSRAETILRRREVPHYADRILGLQEFVTSEHAQLSRNLQGPNQYALTVQLGILHSLLRRPLTIFRFRRTCAAIPVAHAKGNGQGTKEGKESVDQ